MTMAWHRPWRLSEWVDRDGLTVGDLRLPMCES